MGDSEEPKGIDYWYLDREAKKWRIRDDAPEWAKEEFEEFYNDEPDEDGLIRE